jgi:hypothetical protein
MAAVPAAPAGGDDQWLFDDSPPPAEQASPGVALVSRPVNKFVDGQVPTLAECEQYITDVTHQWLLGVGLALKAIRDNELWKSSDAYDSFESYVRYRWDMTRQRAHQLIKSVRVVAIIAPHADREIKEGQTRPLDLILEKHGEGDDGKGKVLEVWQSAIQTGKPTAEALLRIARAKGFLPAAEQTPTSRLDDDHAAAAELAQLRKAVKGLHSKLGQEVARRYPEVAREVADELEAVARDIRTSLSTVQ